MTGEGRAKLSGRVLRSVGGTYHVEVGDQLLECALRGRLKRQRGLGRVAVGDEVVVERLRNGACVITQVLPRRARLSRRTGSGRREQIIAANVDRLAAVFAVTSPEPVFQLLDRFLVLAESNRIVACVVVNKIDLTSAGAARDSFALYEAAGYEVVYVSAKSGSNIELLRELLSGHITLFVGPSGVGKSSLLNSLQPGLGLRVGEVSRSLERGRHTTVTATLHPLSPDGYVVDTPGLGTLRFWEVKESELDLCFPEFRRFLGACRFDDCQHDHEPGCAVSGAVDAGQIPRQRYESYLKILGERADERPGERRQRFR